MTKTLSDKYYQESEEDWEKRMGKDNRRAEDRADEKYHRKREER